MLLRGFGSRALISPKDSLSFFCRALRVYTSLGLGLWALALFSLGLAGALHRGVIIGLTMASAAGTVLYLVRLHKTNRLDFLPPIEALRERYGLLGISLGILAGGYWMLLPSLQAMPNEGAFANLISLSRASSTVSIGESKSILNFRLSANISNPSLSIPVIFTDSAGCLPSSSQ